MRARQQQIPESVTTAGLKQRAVIKTIHSHSEADPVNETETPANFEFLLKKKASPDIRDSCVTRWETWTFQRLDHSPELIEPHVIDKRDEEVVVAIDSKAEPVLSEPRPDERRKDVSARTETLGHNPKERRAAPFSTP